MARVNWPLLRRRRLFDLVIGSSLVLCASMLVLFVRSGFVDDAFDRIVDDFSGWSIVSTTGRVTVAAFDWREPERRLPDGSVTRTRARTRASVRHAARS